MAIHTHPCRDCHTPVECCGQWERNHDGFPEVICDAYHLPGGTLAELLCEDCADKLEADERDSEHALP